MIHGKVTCCTFNLSQWYHLHVLVPPCVLSLFIFLVIYYSNDLISFHSSRDTEPLLVTHHCFLCSCSLTAWRTCIYNGICKQCLIYCLARYMLFFCTMWDYLASCAYVCLVKCSEESVSKSLVGETRVGWLQVHNGIELLQRYQRVLWH